MQADTDEFRAIVTERDQLQPSKVAVISEPPKVAVMLSRLAVMARLDFAPRHRPPTAGFWPRRWARSPAHWPPTPCW